MNAYVQCVCVCGHFIDLCVRKYVCISICQHTHSLSHTHTLSLSHTQPKPVNSNLGCFVSVAGATPGMAGFGGRTPGRDSQGARARARKREQGREIERERRDREREER